MGSEPTSVSKENVHSDPELTKALLGAGLNRPGFSVDRILLLEFDEHENISRSCCSCGGISVGSVDVDVAAVVVVGAVAVVGTIAVVGAAAAVAAVVVVAADVTSGTTILINE